MKHWLLRMQIERALDDGRELNPDLKRHLRSCPSCLSRYSLQETLINALREQSAGEIPPRVSLLQQRILNEIARDESRPAMSSFRFHPASALLACAVLAVGIGIWNLGWFHANPNPSAASDSVARPVPVRLAAADPFPLPSPLPPDRLLAEFDALCKEGGATLRFFAKNFIDSEHLRISWEPEP